MLSSFQQKNLPLLLRLFLFNILILIVKEIK
jgi:hypothetical protein